ncbi:MAG: hypothetical protein AAGD25_32130 [Cyanobacteria bacterium P01_F01_bin.150]
MGLWSVSWPEAGKRFGRLRLPITREFLADLFGICRWNAIALMGRDRLSTNNARIQPLMACLLHWWSDRPFPLLAPFSFGAIA